MSFLPLLACKVDDVEPEQEVLWSAEGCGLEDAGLAELLDRLANKIGADKIHRYLPRECYLPEQSIGLARSLKDKPATTWRKHRPRPSLLLPRPERIEVMAKLPDNPPVFFIYKGVRHEIKKADDVERIEREWWLDDGPAPAIIMRLKTRKAGVIGYFVRAIIRPGMRNGTCMVFFA